MSLVFVGTQKFVTRIMYTQGWSAEKSAWTNLLAALLQDKNQIERFRARNQKSEL